MELTEPYVVDPFPPPPAAEKVREQLDEFIRLHLGVDTVPWEADGRHLAFNLAGTNPIVWQLRYIGANEPAHWFAVPHDGLYWHRGDRVEKWWAGEKVDERPIGGEPVGVPFLI